MLKMSSLCLHASPETRAPFNGKQHCR